MSNTYTIWSEYATASLDDDDEVALAVEGVNYPFSWGTVKDWPDVCMSIIEDGRARGQRTLPPHMERIVGYIQLTPTGKWEVKPTASKEVKEGPYLSNKDIQRLTEEVQEHLDTISHKLDVINHIMEELNDAL